MTTTFYRGLLSGVAGVLLTTTLGCTPTLYVHPTKGPREFAQDSVNCQAKAGQAAGFYDPYGLVRARLYPQCLYGEGWSRVQ